MAKEINAEINAEWLVELTRDTVKQVDQILRMTKTDYIKEFGCETERVDKAKIEKAVIMLGTLKFFIDKVAPSNDDVPIVAPLKDESKKIPLNE